LSVSVLALFYLSSSSDFWKQLRTYSWESCSVKITTSSLRIVADNRPYGEVTFEAIGDPAGHGYSDHLSARFDGEDAQAETAAFIERYAPGSQHVAFLSPDKSTASLGHFPRSYSKQFAILGLLNLVAAVLTFLGLRSHRRALKQAAANESTAEKPV
jgi:hypothetical protein